MNTLLHEGRFLELRREGRWEFARRRRGRLAVGVVALTPEGCLLLVEQHRPPLGRRALELPAGLVGDDVMDEDILVAADRELREETGYAAGRYALETVGPSSAGLTDEMVALVVARDLVRVGEGGGVDGEDIALHAVPLAQVPAFLAAKGREGVAVDPKIYAGLWFAGR